ncbi:MAG: thiolase family protein [Actinobacteria bacterium]|nr:thiolase family protein [Actinomycetota bacterium]MCL5444897.1 thiolase family protein [Actinomycetota bacterium]
MVHEEPLEKRSIISGIGQSEVGRKLNRSDIDLTVEAAIRAIEDAGLTRDDIDGLATYPGMGVGTPGFAGPTTPEVQDALRLELNWHDGGGEGPAQIRAVIAACLAVGAGLAKHVLVYRTVTESTAQGEGGRKGIGGSGGGGGGVPRFSGFLQWYLPFGAVSAANWIALVAQRRFHEFGLTREQLAQIALNARRNAGLNENAVYRDPMSLEDYLAARMISTPLCLFDCDAPSDGSTAVIVSHRDYAKDARHTPIHVNAVGTGLKGRPSWDQFDDMTSMAARDAAASMWKRTELKPSDVDVAELYDGFSILTMVWLEAMGFCDRGESGPFVEGGDRIALGGSLPLNTAGGQLSGGRLHGFGLLHEAVVQLRGDGGERQAPNNPEVAAVSNGGGPIAGSMLLTARPR